nr:immunoglobulin heavy chain junction region [Macaca mulatta]
CAGEGRLQLLEWIIDYW